MQFSSVRFANLEINFLTSYRENEIVQQTTNNYIDLIILNIHTYVDVFWKNWLDIFVIEVNYVSQLDLLVRL